MDPVACSWTRRATSDNGTVETEETPKEHLKKWENPNSWQTTTPSLLSLKRDENFYATKQQHCHARLQEQLIPSIPILFPESTFCRTRITWALETRLQAYRNSESNDFPANNGSRFNPESNGSHDSNLPPESKRSHYSFKKHPLEEVTKRKSLSSRAQCGCNSPTARLKNLKNYSVVILFPA